MKFSFLNWIIEILILIQFKFDLIVSSLLTLNYTSRLNFMKLYILYYGKKLLIF